MTSTAVRPSTVAVPNECGGWSLTLEPAILGLLVAQGLAATDFVPPVAFLAIAVLAAGQVVATRSKPPTAVVLGATQTVLGLAVVLTAGLAWMAP